MAERRKIKKRREETSEKILPTEYAVAKYLKKHLQQKEAMLFNHKVSYFVASKAIDCLMDSNWAIKGKSQEVLFTSRESIIQFMNTLLVHKFFHRARKIVISSKDIKKKKKKEESSDEKEGKKKKKSEKGDEADTKTKKNDKEEESKKKKKRFKLDMHLDQCFVDGNEVYVWIYDPIPTKAWIIGGLLVVGAVLLCLFPLWPQSCRKGVYYLTIAAAGFLVFILALAIIRVVVFCLVWLFSFGKRHLWLLPNLTEDVGFMESFWPLFKYEYRGDKELEKHKEEKKSDSKNVSEKKTTDEDEEDEKPEKGSDDQETEDQLDNDNQLEENEFEVLEADEDDLDEHHK